MYFIASPNGYNRRSQIDVFSKDIEKSEPLLKWRQTNLFYINSYLTYGQERQ